MSLGATQPLKKRLRTSNPPATFESNDGEIGLAVMGEVELFTLRLCQSDVYAPFLQVSEQCRMGEFAHLQMLETRFGCLLAKRERIWDGCVVPVPLSCQADKAHGRMRTVPLQVR